LPRAIPVRFGTGGIGQFDARRCADSRLLLPPGPSRGHARCDVHSTLWELGRKPPSRSSAGSAARGQWMALQSARSWIARPGASVDAFPPLAGAPRADRSIDAARL